MERRLLLLAGSIFGGVLLVGIALGAGFFTSLDPAKLFDNPAEAEAAAGPGLAEPPAVLVRQDAERGDHYGPAGDDRRDAREEEDDD